MYELLLRVLLLTHFAAAQRFHRDYDARPIGLLARRLQDSPEKSLDKSVDLGNSSMQLLDNNVFLNSLGLSKRQTCSSGNASLPTHEVPAVPPQLTSARLANVVYQQSTAAPIFAATPHARAARTKAAVKPARTAAPTVAIPDRAAVPQAVIRARSAVMVEPVAQTIRRVAMETPTPSREPNEPEEPEDPQASSPNATPTPTPTCTHNPLELVKRIHTDGQCSPKCPLPTPAATIVFAHVTKSLPIFPPEVLQATPSLVSVMLDNSRLLRNMCMGMKALTGATVNSVILTRHTNSKINAGNRRAMCKQSNGRSNCGKDPNMTAPDGTPLDVPSYLGDFDFSSDWYKSKKRWYLRTECDEFPFASSCEGGSTSSGSRYCLSAWENRWGSWQMGPWNALSAGQRAKISVDSSTWDCSIQGTVPGGGPVGAAKPAKRLVKKADLWTDGYDGGDLYTDILGQGKNGLGMTLGDLEAGNYTIRLNVTQGSFQEFFVVDGGGAQVTTPKVLAASERSLNFTLTEPVDDAFLAAWTKDMEVAVDYTIANATMPTTSAGEKHVPVPFLIPLVAAALLGLSFRS